MLKRNVNPIAWFVMLSATVFVSVAQVTPVREEISTRRIAEAMSVSGIVVSAAQIEILSAGVRAKENASLRVVSTSNRSAGATLVKLRCQDNQQCLPFYVLVHGTDAMATLTGGREVQAVVSNTRGVLPPTIIHGGDRATLILESADSLMRLPVVCLQSGSLGEKIQVASPDHRQFFDAEVIAAGMLKGKL